MIIAITVNQAIFQNIWDHSSSRHITGYKADECVIVGFLVTFGHGQVDMNTKIIAITVNQAILKQIRYMTGWQDWSKQ